MPWGYPSADRSLPKECQMCHDEGTAMASDMNATSSSAPKPAQIFLYFSPLTLLVYLVLPHGYLLDIATTYMLKDQLRATATEVSMFRLVTAIPVYLSFAFGFTRDLWNPLGMRDRGYFL